MNHSTYRIGQTVQVLGCVFTITGQTEDGLFIGSGEDSGDYFYMDGETLDAEHAEVL